MSDIGVGDWVECVAAISKRPHALTIGRLYQVTRVYPGPFSRCEFGVEVSGASSVSESGFSCNNFRPIYRPKQAIIEALKAPPKHVKERV